jgi:hypothetical protein
MLCSSGDFPRTLSSILSGEGLDERELGQSPSVFWACHGPCTYFPATLSEQRLKDYALSGGRNSVGAAKRFPSGPSATMRRFYLHVDANSGVASSAS